MTAALAPPRPPRLRSRQRTDPALTFSKLSDVMSTHCGIVTDVNRLQMVERGLADVYGYGVEIEGASVLACDAIQRHRAKSAPEAWRTFAEGRNGHRVAYDRTRAFVRAIGEALERYACCTYDPSGFVTGSFEELSRANHVLDPRTCQGPTEYELRFHADCAPFDPSAPHRWTWGWSLRDERPILAPAQFCYLMYNPVPGERRLQASTSTGWAIHHTFEEAIHTGMREVIERDGFFLHWLNRLTMPRLDLDTVRDPAVASFRDEMRRVGADLRVHMTTTDVGIPSFAAMLVDRRPGHPAFLLTLGAHPDPVRGLRQAVEECAMVHVHSTARARIGVKAVAKQTDIRRMSDHGEFYLLQQNLPILEWMFGDEEVVAFDDLPALGSPTGDVWEEVRTMVKGFAGAGLDAIFVDTTPPDLREAGWCAAKTLIPGSVRHEYGYGMRYLACPRIFEAPVRMGRRDRPTRLDELNPDAHPYA